MKPGYWYYGVPILLILLMFFYIEGWLFLKTARVEIAFLPHSAGWLIFIFVVGTLFSAFGTAAFSTVFYYKVIRDRFVGLLTRKKASG